MENGSSEIEEETEAPKKLNFLQKLGIAFDVACALRHLVQHSDAPMIHSDLSEAK